MTSSAALASISVKSLGGMPKHYSIVLLPWRLSKRATGISEPCRSYTTTDGIIDVSSDSFCYLAFVYLPSASRLAEPMDLIQLPQSPKLLRAGGRPQGET